MKITEIENEEALDLLADLIDPASEIFTDEEVREEARNGKNKLKLVKLILKKHKTAIIQILARLDGKQVNEYHANLILMTKQLLEILNDKELLEVFISQGQKMDSTSSGSATENIEAEK